MNTLSFSFGGADLEAMSSGGLYWPEQDTLVVSDLHLGKSERMARRTGQMLPPYETIETLGKLDEALGQTAARKVICLGDSFDDLEAGRSLPEDHVNWITRMMAGREWIWIEGNHDPGPLEFGGSHLLELALGPLTFRHIATPNSTGEVSGHYHPKARLSLRGRTLTRPCFLRDESRLILPAFGHYTGGLYSDAPILSGLMEGNARAILTGQPLCELPMPR